MQGYYERRAIECFVEPVGGAAAAAGAAVAAGSPSDPAGATVKVTAHVYVLTRDVGGLVTLARSHIQNYTLELHLSHYKPIQHILVKQQKYLGNTEGGRQS
jgi:hypothetical protein